jgi:hypothetical protein
MRHGRTRPVAKEKAGSRSTCCLTCWSRNSTGNSTASSLRQLAQFGNDPHWRKRLRPTTALLRFAPVRGADLERRQRVDSGCLTSRWAGRQSVNSRGALHRRHDKSRRRFFRLTILDHYQSNFFAISQNHVMMITSLDEKALMNAPDGQRPHPPRDRRNRREASKGRGS